MSKSDAFLTLDDQLGFNDWLHIWVFVIVELRVVFRDPVRAAPAEESSDWVRLEHDLK